jgi:hypothetical protein
MALSPDQRLREAVSAAAAHRAAYPNADYRHPDILNASANLDEAWTQARQDFHSVGGTAEHADRIEDEAFEATERGRAKDFGRGLSSRG